MLLGLKHKSIKITPIPITQDLLTGILSISLEYNVVVLAKIESNQRTWMRQKVKMTCMTV